MNASTIKSLLATSMLIFCQLAFGAELLVSNQKEFVRAVKGVQPGDTIVMANGEWKDFEMVLRGAGTASEPITLRAQDKGKVIVTGLSNLRMAGEYLVVSGLVFKNGYTPRDSVISFRIDKKNLANHSRVTEVVIDNFNNPERFETDYWVALYGKHNRFDHNHLEGKRNQGVTMAVRLDSEESRENRHRIDHNYFGPRPILGSNGGETLRIGTSHYSLSDSLTVIENNYFDRCDGELEIISNKSGGNIIRGNVFFESKGTLTLRHGNGNLIEDNVFFGNGVDHTGGIRVINKNQTIRNNYMEGLAGYRFGGALVVMNGVPNSSINRYHQVDGAVIENNSLINSDHIQLAAGSDKERSAVPVNSRFTDNLIVSDSSQDVFTVYDDISGIKFKDNIISGAKAIKDTSGFISKKIKLKRASNGLMYPVGKGFDDAGVKRSLKPISKQQTGVDWYPKAAAAPIFETGRKIKVTPAADVLVYAVSEASAGDVIELAPGEYLSEKIIVIDKPLTIRAKKSPAKATGLPTVEISYMRSTLFEIVDGGSLHLSGLAINGKNSPDNAGNSVIRTSNYSMLVNYQLVIDHCTVTDLDINHSYNFINVAKSTLADRIDISNSHFSNVTGSILNLDKETDDYGIYNAEYVNISNSSFESVQGRLIDYYRGGTDESTFGPHFKLEKSTLDNVGNGKRNKSAASILVHGVQVVNIDGNTFSNSPAIKVMHTVGEPKTVIVNNNFNNTPAPVVQELNSSKKNTAHIANNTARISEK
jgi:poly(beta-D-mannuronate) lyase